MRDLKNMVSRVASGIRRMDKKPDALLYFDDYSSEATCDLAEISGIPIYHASGLPMSSEMDSYDCPFYPIFKGEVTNTLLNRDFIRGYEDDYHFTTEF